MVFQVAGSNATEVNAEISKLLSEINEELPEGLEFMTMMSSNDFLFASIHEVVETLIVAINPRYFGGIFLLAGLQEYADSVHFHHRFIGGNLCSHANCRFQY